MSTANSAANSAASSITNGRDATEETNMKTSSMDKTKDDSLEVPDVAEIIQVLEEFIPQFKNKEDARLLERLALYFRRVYPVGYTKVSYLKRTVFPIGDDVWYDRYSGIFLRQPDRGLILGEPFGWVENYGVAAGSLPSQGQQVYFEISGERAFIQRSLQDWKRGNPTRVQREREDRKSPPARTSEQLLSDKKLLEGVDLVIPHMQASPNLCVGRLPYKNPAALREVLQRLVMLQLPVDTDELPTDLFKPLSGNEVALTQDQFVTLSRSTSGFRHNVSWSGPREIRRTVTTIQDPKYVITSNMEYSTEIKSGWHKVADWWVGYKVEDLPYKFRTYELSFGDTDKDQKYEILLAGTKIRGDDEWFVGTTWRPWKTFVGTCVSRRAEGFVRRLRAGSEGRAGIADIAGIADNSLSSEGVEVILPVESRESGESDTYEVPVGDLSL